MFESLLFQDAGKFISQDIKNNKLPQSILFSGQPCSGKLTAALELARVLSCYETPQGQLHCSCSSCLKHKALNHSELLIMGPRNCLLEIYAAQKAFNNALETQSSHIKDSQYLFIRSIKKLIMRFHPILWEGEENKLTNAVSLISEINEYIEELDPQRSLPSMKIVTKAIDSLVNLCKKLDNGFLYDTIPVSQIRRASIWANVIPLGSKKILIIENADKMQDSARNALLKTLEEPPKDTIFILTTNQRGALISTILSRVRIYEFIHRTQKNQQDIITTVFYDTGTLYNSLSEYLNSFLPVSPSLLQYYAFLFVGKIIEKMEKQGYITSVSLKDTIQSFFNTNTLAVNISESDIKELYDIQENSIEDICGFVINKTKNFEPRILFRIFLTEIIYVMRIALRSPKVCARDYQIMQAWTTIIGETVENVYIYNQSPTSSLDLLHVKLESCFNL